LLLFGPPGSVIVCSVADPHHLDAGPDADPDLTYHFDADPDPYFYLMRIRIRLFTPIRIRILVSNKSADPRKSALIGSFSIHFGLSSAN
jgi:hypothetical protein